MTSSTARCDRIISMIDACLAEFEGDSIQLDIADDRYCVVGLIPS